MAKKQDGKCYEKDGYKLGRRGDIYVADYGKGRSRKRPTLGTFRREEDAIAALHKFIDARKALQRQQAQHTIGDLWEKWLAYRAKNGFSNVIYNFNWASMAPAFRHLSANMLTEDECMDYARGRFAAGKKPSTVATELARLRACLNWAAKRRFIEFAPVVWVPPRGKPRKVVVTADEARDLLMAAYDDVHCHVFIALALTTAARHMAILDLEWSRTNFETGIIDYEVEILRDPMSKSYTKGRAQVPMNPLVRAALLRAYEIRQTDHVIEYRGKRLKSIRESFALAVGRAGLGEFVPAPTKTKPKRMRVVTDITPHTLRHSVNTWLQEQGIDAEKRSKLLGHADVRTNQLNYSHGRPNELLTGAVLILDAALTPCPATTKQGKTAGRGVRDETKLDASWQIGTDAQLLENPE
jgi:integrase